MARGHMGEGESETELEVLEEEEKEEGIEEAPRRRGGYRTTIIMVQETSELKEGEKEREC